MKISLKLSIPILISSLLFMAFQCEDEEIPEVEFEYTFAEKVNLHPARKSYKVGDTIWIEYNNPDKRLFDALSNQEIFIDSVSLNFFIGFGSTYYGATNPVGGFFDYVTKNVSDLSFHTSTYGANLWFFYGCGAQYNQQFKVGLILKQKGIYQLHLLNSKEVGGNQLGVGNCPGKKLPVTPALIDYTFNVADANKEIYTNIPPISRMESIKGFTEGKIDRKEIFMIRVE